MRGEYHLTQHDLQGSRAQYDTVGLRAYNMEPQYMIPGQAAGTAALATTNGIAVQRVDPVALQRALVAEGLVLAL